MWVVYNSETGWSDESMRFATRSEALDYMEERPDESFAYRYEH